MTERKGLVYKQIKFIDEFLLPQAVIIFSEELVRNVDPDDTLHIALTEHLKAKLWTGDKKLIEGLISKRYQNFIDTNGLWKMRNNTMNE